MKLFVSLLLILVPTNCWEIVHHPYDDLSLDEVLKPRGFVGLDTYYFETLDGYILNVHRIKQKNAEKLTPILLLHGWSGCAESFFANPNKSIPILLAQNGYDVWLLNNRATINAKHANWTQADRKYWDFTLLETSSIDVPTGIDFVLDHNEHSKLILIGHSEGSTEIFILLSERPEYNDQVLLQVHLSVSVYHTQCASSSVIRIGCNLAPVLKDLADILEIHSVIIPQNVRQLLRDLCKISVFKGACKEFAKTFLYSDEEIDSIDFWSYVFKHAWCGGSMGEIFHFVQIGNTGRFAKYDYGIEENLERYNSSQSPLFDLKNVQAPVSILNPAHDIFVQPEDLKRLLDELTNVEMKQIDLFEEFSHSDLILGKSLETSILPKLLKILRRFEKLL